MNILVTAIGTMAGTTVIRMLKKNKNISVFGADINEKDLIYASREVDNYVQFPSVINNDDYLNYILDFCKKK